MVMFPSFDATYSAEQRRRMRPVYGYAPMYLTRVKRSESESGKSQRRDTWGVTRFIAQGMVFMLRPEDSSVLHRFWRTYRLDTFDFIDFNRGYHPNISFGTTTAGAQTITAPVYGPPSPAAVHPAIDTLTLDGTPFLGATLHSFVTFLTADDNLIQPTVGITTTAGQAITANLTGQLQYLVEFMDDPTFEVVSPAMVRVTMSVREVF